MAKNKKEKKFTTEYVFGCSERDLKKIETLEGKGYVYNGKHPKRKCFTKLIK